MPSSVPWTVRSPGTAATLYGLSFGHGTYVVVGAGYILFGAWSQAILADWGAIDITVNPYTKARLAVIEVTAHWLVDFAVRHPESFCKGTGLTA